MTVWQIDAYDELKTPKFFDYAANFLLEELQSSILIADVWSDDNDFFPEYVISRLQLSKHRSVYTVNVEIVRDINESWFETILTLLGICPDEAALKAYIEHKSYIPEKALRRGYLTAYFCGNKNGGYSIANKGRHLDLLEDLKGLFQ